MIKKYNSSKNIILKNKVPNNKLKKYTPEMNFLKQSQEMKILNSKLTTRTNLNKDKDNKTNKNFLITNKRKSSKNTFIKTFDNQINNYKVKELLGEGSYAKVYKAYDINNNVCAIKIYEKEKMSTESRIKNMKNEIEILKSLNCKFLINYINHFENNEKYYLVMEYMEGETLKVFSQKYYKGRVKTNLLKYILKQLLKGIDFLHKNYIYHRDLKLSNIIINKDYKIKIIDFGFSCKSINNEKLEKFLGTFNYMSPELLLKRKYYGDKVDIWALGVIIYKLLTGDYPFKADNKKNLKMKIIYINFYKSYKVPDFYQKLFDLIFVFKQDQRTNINELYKKLYE